MEPNITIDPHSVPPGAPMLEGISPVLSESPCVDLKSPQAPGTDAPSANSVEGRQATVSLIHQGYLAPAPQGIGAEYAWKFAGGDGAGLRFVDVEQGWELKHEDLTSARITLLCGTPSIDPAKLRHGTAVLGIIAAQNNRKDILGIAYGVTAIRVASSFNVAGTGDPLTEAINRAVDELRFGDVLLIEEQTNAGGKHWRPVEAIRATYGAILNATRAGVVVIEPAGNGPIDLDHPDAGMLLEDSGAIMVGAATNDLPHFRTKLSNFGRRVDCFAWGKSIVTLQGGRDILFAVDQHLERFAWAGSLVSPRFLKPSANKALNEKLTTDFGDTSGAAAIIAGVALCIQGLAQQHLHFHFSPLQLRLLLNDPRNGTPSGNGDPQSIGVMPDLKKIVGDVLNLPPCVYLRDHVGDTGEEPRGILSASPDIVVSRPGAQDPQKKLGEDSGTENDLIGLSPYTGSQYSVFLRARNRGGNDANHVVARIYRSEVASLLVPSLWEPLETTTTFSKIAQGDLLTVSPAVEWQIQGNMEDPLYVAWIALVGNGQEEIPQEPSTLKRFRELLQCGQLACRNFHMAGHPKVCDERDPRSYVRLPFKAPGAPDKSLKMHLETVSHLPRKAKVWLATPPDMADSKGISADPPSEDGKPEDGLVYVPVNPSGRHYFRESVFERGSLAKLKLVIFIPREFRKNSYQISVRQIWENEEVGRVTWRISNADPR